MCVGGVYSCDDSNDDLVHRSNLLSTVQHKNCYFLYEVWCMADNCVFMLMVHDKKNKNGFIKLCGVCFNQQKKLITGL